MALSSGGRITLVVRGEGMRYVGDSIEPFRANDLVLLGRHLPHQWVSIGKTKMKEQQAIVIQFQETLFQSFPEYNGINKMIGLAKRGLYFSSPDVALIREIQDLLDLPPAIQLSRLMTILYHLSLEEKQKYLSQNLHFNTKSNEKNQLKINTCTSYIVEHLSGPLSVHLMAERTNMVPQSFCRWFKQNTGLSFITFLNKTRIQSACQYLVNTDLPIQQIGFQVGFENISHFNRTFKKIMGGSPSQFRKRKR